MGTNKINVLSIKFVPPKNCRKYIEFVAIYIQSRQIDKQSLLWPPLSSRFPYYLISFWKLLGCCCNMSTKQMCAQLRTELS